MTARSWSSAASRKTASQSTGWPTANRSIAWSSAAPYGYWPASFCISINSRAVAFSHSFRAASGVNLPRAIAELDVREPELETCDDCFLLRD